MMATRHLRRLCTVYRRSSIFNLPKTKPRCPKQQLAIVFRKFSDEKKSTETAQPTINIELIDEEPTPEDTKDVGDINPEEYTKEVSVELPDLGEVKGKIVKWYVKEGDVVHPNETICDIETELFTFGMDVEDENEGIMKEILIKEGDESYDPGTPICTIMHKPMQ